MGAEMGAGPLNIAVLVKQVPRFTDLRMGREGRLAREGVGLELNPYCRRAVSKGIDLARSSGGRCVVLSLGPPRAEDCLREAVACGADAGILVTDPVFAGSDTLATARALAAALRRTGPFDLVLCGRSSADADTGQVPSELAELLGLPFAAGVRELDFLDRGLRVRCEHDDGWWQAALRMPALLSCAERLIRPAKADPEARAAVAVSRIRRLDAAALGPGPWGQAASMTAVGRIVDVDVARVRRTFDGEPAAQVRHAVAAMARRGAFDATSQPVAATPPASTPVPPPATASAGDRRRSEPRIAVLAEPGRDRMTRELLGAAAVLAHRLGGTATALLADPLDLADAGAWGADTVVVLENPSGTTRRFREREIATAFADWCAQVDPWAVLAPSTMWGREVAGRIAARCGFGLVGDAVDLQLDQVGPDCGPDRLLCAKPSFGGAFISSVTCLSATQMATVRPGVLPLLEPRAAVATAAAWQVPETSPDGWDVWDVRRTTTDDPDALGRARAVVCVGAGVPVDEYPLLGPLLKVLDAELAATRKVTDRGWQPRSRQIGITGRSIAAGLVVSVGVQGSVNHMIGVRRAGTILAVNDDPGAPVFAAADFGVVADWRVAVPLLVEEIERHR